MKLAIIFIGCCLIGLSSCAELKELSKIDAYESVYEIDFSPFTQKDFLITPEKYLGEYESIGLIDYTIMPEANYVTVGIKKNVNYSGGVGSSVVEDKKWVSNKVDARQALDSIYIVCLEMGADALVNFKISTQEDNYQLIKNPIKINGITITGFAIKRK